MSDQPALFQDGELAVHPTGPVAQAIEIWNEAAGPAGWPVVTAKTVTRLARMKKALLDCGGVAGWKSMLGACQASPFLMGRTTPPFTLTFDWLTKPANLVKVLEGNYKDRRGTAAPKKTWRENQVDEARAAIEKAFK